jgi:hypothetical protein
MKTNLVFVCIFTHVVSLNNIQAHRVSHMFEDDIATYVSLNGRVSEKPRRLPRHQRAQAHNSTHYRHQFKYWLCSKQNRLLCAYEHDFGDNYIITIV